MDCTVRSAGLWAGIALILVLVFALPQAAVAQGCSQCREAMGQTPERTQTAYRRAITLMVAAGATVFAAGVVTLKRFR